MQQSFSVARVAEALSFDQKVSSSDRSDIILCVCGDSRMMVLRVNFLLYTYILLKMRYYVLGLTPIY